MATNSNHTDIISHEYSILRQLNKDMKNTRKRLTNSIMRRIKPYMWECGYSFKIVCFSNEKYYKPKGVGKSITAYSGAYCGIGGFTEEGNIITDAYAGGLSVQHLSTLCTEDLINLWAWIDRNIHLFEKANSNYTA